MRSEVESPAGRPGAAPGRRSLTGAVPPRAPNVRAAAEASAAASSPVTTVDPVVMRRQLDEALGFLSPLDVASAGVAGAAAPLPHLETIQGSFGRHDVRAVQAQVGGAAVPAARALGAEAYATGNTVAFRSAPDLHTAAHEAAHVVQQRAGVSLRGEMGEAGDAYERHADRVADAVVQGASAESILDEMAAVPAAPRGVQREECNAYDIDDYPMEYEHCRQDFSDWAELTSYRPPATTQEELMERGMTVHAIEDASGSMSMDLYEVNVAAMPPDLKPIDLLTMIQQDMTSFVDSSISEFNAYSTEDGDRLTSGSSEGAVVSIGMYADEPTTGTNVDDGSVVSSAMRKTYMNVHDVTAASFIFSTVWTPDDWSHPVSGNREFGFRTSGNQIVFYTRGADRPTGFVDNVAEGVIFDAADRLWKSWQEGVTAYINDEGGTAAVGRWEANRQPWADVEASLHKPPGTWEPGATYDD